MQVHAAEHFCAGIKSWTCAGAPVRVAPVAATRMTENLMDEEVLARLQRKFRLLESGYRTPQTLVGGPRADAG